MLYTYPACYFKEDTGYSVFFPDFNNVATCGDDIAEATYMAIDLLAGLLEDLLEDNKALPVPTPLDSVNPQKIAEALDFTYDDYFINNIVVDVEEHAKNYFGDNIVRMIAIPRWLEDKIIDSDDMTESQVVEEALKQYFNVK